MISRSDTDTGILDLSMCLSIYLSVCLPAYQLVCLSRILIDYFTS